MDRWQGLCEAVEAERRRVLDHPLYRSLDSVDALRIFAEHHVWAVWDFMSLITALQREVTCTTVPWVPTAADTTAQRFVNEIKLGEETDDHPDGGWCSHLGLYLGAMREIGADPTPIENMLKSLRRTPDADVDALAQSAGAPPGAVRFVNCTLGYVRRGTLPEIAAVFALGREELVPDMFRPLLETNDFNLFSVYLLRHIELDGDTHGPMAHRLVQVLCGEDEAVWDAAEAAAVDAMAARRRLWDDTLDEIRLRVPQPTLPWATA